MTIALPGEAFRIALISLMLSIPPDSIPSKMTSGPAIAACDKAARPSPTSPIIVTSGASLSHIRSPSRMAGWFSTSRSRIMGMFTGCQSLIDLEANPATVNGVAGWLTSSERRDAASHLRGVQISD